VADSESDPDPIDRVVEQILLGRDPDVEGLIAGTPELAPDAQARMRKIAGTFGHGGVEAEPDLEELGPYKVLSRMGEGGMGRVYLAEHRFLERRVALKIIRPELALSSATRRRFQSEAKRIAKLRHENIVSVYDAGEHEGVAFLAMEVVEGPALDDVLRTGRYAGETMDVSLAVRHARDVARALACAHAAGIVHRDVKPSNVRITPDGRALLLDFGLSLAEEAVPVSSAGQFRGTPQYASPEQIDARSAEIDARTDVYSLGVTLYECLTGEVPFEGATLVQLFHRILTVDPPQARELNPRVDPVLNGIVERAMAKRPEDRFASAEDMARALDDWLVVGEPSAPAARRAPSRIARPLVAAALIAAVLAAAWFLLRGSAGVEGSHPRATRELFGGAERAFDQRLADWAPLAGGGTFGADQDTPGVVGICVGGLGGESYALPEGNGSVRGRFEPIAPGPGSRTRAAGAGVEFVDGRAVVLVLVSAAEGDRLCTCELVRHGDSSWARGPELESRDVISRESRPHLFRMTWSDAGAQIDCDGAAFTIPRGTARPSRFLLVVEDGSALFEDVVLEQS
jgi:tRNA A-37 threonylcarbamoyl transferase component Bud32